MIERREFSVYGKSLLDLYFYIGDSGDIVKSAVIRKLEDHDDGGQGKDYSVVCGLAKFKLQTGSLKMHCSQIFEGALLT